jgi:hypothetical protein
VNVCSVTMVPACRYTGPDGWYAAMTGNVTGPARVSASGCPG